MAATAPMPWAATERTCSCGDRRPAAAPTARPPWCRRRCCRAAASFASQAVVLGVSLKYSPACCRMITVCSSLPSSATSAAAKGAVCDSSACFMNCSACCRVALSPCWIADSI